MKRRSWLPEALFAVYLAALLCATVFRPGICLRELGQHGSIQTTPFLEYYWWLRQRRFGPLLYLFGGNVAAFCPFGGYLVWRRGWSLRRAVLAGLVLSLFIEAGQYLLGTGITDLADVILNTVGAFLGAAAVSLAQKRRRTARTHPT